MRFPGRLNPRLRDWRGRRVWIVGASAGIGAALARALAEQGAILALSARNTAVCAGIVANAADNSMTVALDVTEQQSIAHASSRILAQWGRIDLVIWLAGTYEPVDAGNFDLEATRRILDTNLSGLYNGLASLAPNIQSGKVHGLAIVASVAGFRGLPRSLVYGPSKAAQINLAESLYLDLHQTGTGVWLINPGFVDTALTAANPFPMPALVTPAEAARAILRGFASGRFDIHFPRRFSWLMKALAILPYPVYFRLVAHFTRPASTSDG